MYLARVRPKHNGERASRQRRQHADARIEGEHTGLGRLDGRLVGRRLTKGRWHETRLAQREVGGRLGQILDFERRLLADVGNAEIQQTEIEAGGAHGEARPDNGGRKVAR